MKGYVHTSVKYPTELGCSELATWHGLKESDEVELEIKEKARDGRGIGRVRGLIVFVNDASVGEKVRVRIVRIAARHAIAEIIQRLNK